MSALPKKPEENNSLNNVRFESDVELIFMLSMNMLLLLHLLLPYAFSLRWAGVGVVSAETEDVNREFIHEFGSRSRPC